MMSSVLDSEIPNEMMQRLRSSVDDPHFSKSYIEITGEEMKDVLEYLQTQQRYLFDSWAVVGSGEGVPWQEGGAEISKGYNPLTEWELQLQQGQSEELYNGIVVYTRDGDVRLTDSWEVLEPEEQKKAELLPQSLSASWIFMTQLEPSAPPLEVKPVPGFFDDWPSFGVQQKLRGIIMYYRSSIFLKWLRICPRMPSHSDF